MFDFLSRRFSDIFSSLMGTGKLTEANVAQALEKVQAALIDADVPCQVACAFVESVKDDVLGQQVLCSVQPGQQFIKLVHDRLVAFLGGAGARDVLKKRGICLVTGLQGSGKTTSIAKLAHAFKKSAPAGRVMLASVDFYRPAAVDQLDILARSVGATFYRSEQTNPVEAAQDAVRAFRSGHFEYLFLDTAGRLHVDEPMLHELCAIKQAVKPDCTLLVIDGMIGQESLAVARAFDDRVGLDAALITKMDSDARAGVAFAFLYVLKKPIWYVGTGEKMDDLEPFKADRVAGRMLGMGDVLSLVERAQEKVQAEKQDSLRRAFEQGTFTLQDFADQLDCMGSLGSLTQLVKYLPGMGSVTLSPADLERGEREMKLFRAIILSMTPKERFCPAILDGSRKNRIARGAGVQVAMVNHLLARFKESQRYAKLFKKFVR